VSYSIQHCIQLVGYICLSPEYPESLASSYPNIDGLDRGAITERLLNVLKSDLKLSASSYGIVGHSLGCGTAMMTGDDSWTRVCIAGPSTRRDGVDVGGNMLSILSANDGLMSRTRIDDMIPTDFVRLEESTLDTTNDKMKFSQKSAIVFDRVDAPNHISFLSSETNDSMIKFLSPLLPVAQALEIPVLDFDKYKESQDSKATANIVIPLVSAYFNQFMS